MRNYLKKIRIIILSTVLIISVGAMFAFKVELPMNNNSEINDNATYVDSSNNSQQIKLVKHEPMIASWYGPKFDGKLTANGEIYDQMAYTAAHKTLPFGTLLKVTNPLNKKSVIVRINDRGPYIEGRNIDLSKGTAEALGMLEDGVIQVEIMKIEFDEDSFPVLAQN